MKKGLTILSFLFICILAVNMVSAVKPSPLINTGSEGLQIFYPQFESVKYNTSFKLHLHISNISNGVPLQNTVADCYLHLYGMTGSHILESGALAKDSNGWDYEIEILGSNFSESGETNGFYVWCNDTVAGLGGEAKGVYSITGNGEPKPEGILVLGFVIMMLLIFIFMTFYLIRAVGLIIDASFDILDIAYAWGLYFGLLGLNQMAIIYLGNKAVMDWLSLFVTILAFPLVVLPVLAFFLSLFREDKSKKAEASKW